MEIYLGIGQKEIYNFAKYRAGIAKIDKIKELIGKRVNLSYCSDRHW